MKKVNVSKRNNVGFLGIILVAALGFGVVIVNGDSSATSASTALASVKVAASCTLTTSGGGNYSATVPNGTSAEIAGSTMSVSCNDAGGFALYAVGYSNDTIGNNNMIGTSTNIPTNTSGTNSYWAMKINPTSGNTPTIENSFNNYHIIPDSHTKIASYSSSTGTGSLSVDATYKANISSTQLAGNYLGKVKYTLVHPANEIMPHEIACDPGKICYNANTNIVEGQMGKQSAYNGFTTILWASNFKRDGYGFAGWSDEYDYETNPDAHLYGPQESITAPSDISTNGLSLYAVWLPPAGALQNWNGCSSMNIGDVTALTDIRDNDTYAVAKLADGKCWMIENLRLNNNPELSLSNTHNPSLPLTNSNGTISNHLSPATDPSQTSWCAAQNNSCVNQSMLSTNNTTFFINNTSGDQSSDVYSYGNYYNWYSATAGNGMYEMANQNVIGDVCPIGWHLPTTSDGGSEDYNVLDISLGGNGGLSNNNTSPTGATVSKAWRAYPNNFVFSGSTDEYTGTRRGEDGLYYSSSASYTYSRAFYLSFNNNAINVASGMEYKSSGFAIRCVNNNN